MKKLFRRDAGFTLTELAVAMLIIGILAAIAVPSFLGARNDAYDREAQAGVVAALNAADMHYANYGDFTESTSADCGGTVDLVSDFQRLEPNFMFQIETDPSNQPRTISIDSADTFNSNGENLGCQVFYAAALSRSGTCFVGRLSVEGKFLTGPVLAPPALAAAPASDEIVVKSNSSDSNAAIGELTGLAVNGRAYGAIKVDPSSAAGATGDDPLADAAGLCNAHAQADAAGAVGVLSSEFYDGWRTVVDSSNGFQP